MAITLNISGEVDGTFTVEDNGVPGDGISVLRRPDGTIFQTFAHPADLLTILSRAGQTIVFNTTDAFTTTNITIGSLTTASQRPSAIEMGNVVTSGIVTLTTSGAISEFGSDAANDITAGTLFMLAGTGIGAFNPIETQVTVLEAESTTGGINLVNFGNLSIGGVSGSAILRGLLAGTSGNITLINQGSITLSDETSLATITSAGNVTLSAIGAAADLGSNVNQDAITAVGNIFLRAGRDVNFGTAGANFDNDVRAGGSIFVNAGRDFHIDANSDMVANDLGLGTNGGISITAGRDILIDDVTGVDASVGVTTGTGSVLLTTGVGGSLVLHANSANALFGGAGGVTVRADRILIEPDSGIVVTDGGTVTLTTATAGHGINLGVATDSTSAMELSDAELDRIVAQNVAVGSSESGTLSVNGPITHPNSNLTLRSGDNIVFNASITTPAALTLIAAESISQGALTTITTSTFTAFVDTPDVDPQGAAVFLNGTVTAGSISVTGNADSDLLNGTPGNDIINGLGGADNMVGGPGDDIYFADNSGDAVFEFAGHGRDVVYVSGAVFFLSAGSHVDVLSTAALGATTAINLVGNELVQEIYGNAGENILNGGGGADYIAGLAGNDTYIISSGTEIIVESAGQGRDVVYTGIDYTLAAGVSIEALSVTALGATDPINLFGNELGQEIYGNAGANMIGGGGGEDFLVGFFGNDTYFITSGVEAIVEDAGQGSDILYAAISYTLNAGAQVEVLSTAALGATTAINLTGNEFGQDLYGNAGANTLDGGGGGDLLTGFGGADNFAFTTALGPGNIDAILDFQAGLDKIVLENAVFTGLAPGALPAAAFRLGSAAADADDRIIYDPGTGALYFDADGNGAGAQVQFAVLGAALSASDFIVI